MIVNKDLVLKAAKLQIEINNDIDLLGFTNINKAESLEKLIDSFNSSEEDLFIQLLSSN